MVVVTVMVMVMVTKLLLLVSMLVSGDAKGAETVVDDRALADISC